MSTHVDGAPPSVSPDPDGEPDRQQSDLDDGSQWVRAEIQRRMAASRSTRGRHARRGDSAAPDGAATDGPGERGARDSPRREPVVPPSPPQSVPLPPPGFVAAGDLPENYVPRHSVQTPGPAAEPAAPISGPIPIVRPASAADAPDAERRPPVGGPSLPPTGLPLPVRKKRSGPGTPLHGGGTPAAGPWSRPGTSIVPSGEPVQRLGAPPGMLGGTEAVSWGVPTSPPRGFAPAPADPVPADVPPVAADVEADAVATDEVAGFTDQPTPVEAAEPVAATNSYLDYDDYDDDDLDDLDDLEDLEDEDEDDEDDDVDVDPEPGATDARDDGPPAVDPAEVTTTVLPVIDGSVPPPARMVGIPVQRPSARAVPPRPVTPRHIPVVGTAPPEPGSTRVRVVLSERKGIARPVRTIKEVQEGTAVGEMLRRDLIRSQLLVALRFGVLAVLVLGALPAILTLLPAVGRFDVLGLRVPWLLLGVLMYPFLVGVAWRFTRVADRVEQDFADHVQD